MARPTDSDDFICPTRPPPPLTSRQFIVPNNQHQDHDLRFTQLIRQRRENNHHMILQYYIDEYVAIQTVLQMTTLDISINRNQQGMNGVQFQTQTMQ